MQHSLPVIAASLSDTRKSWEFLRYQPPGKSSAAVPAGSAGGIFPPGAEEQPFRAVLGKPTAAASQAGRQHSQSSAPAGSAFLRGSPARASWNQLMY